MRKVLITALALAICSPAVAQTVMCDGQESTGSGLTSCPAGDPRDYAYPVTDPNGSMTDLFVGTDDPNLANYTNVCSPPGWTFTIQTDPFPIDHTPYKTPHGALSVWTGANFPFVIHWSGPAGLPGGAFTFGFDHPWPSHDVGWRHIDGIGTTAENWAMPVGMGVGPVHAPHEPPADTHATAGVPATVFDFGHYGPIPADFFGPGSDPFDGVVAFEGDPQDPGMEGNTSTKVQRSADPFHPEDPPGGPSEVALEIVSLNLVSIAPITVTYGGLDPEQWDLQVDLSETVPPPGYFTATKTHDNGGTFSAYLPVQPRLTFTKVLDPGQVKVLDTGADMWPPISFMAGGHWVHNVNPALDIYYDSRATMVLGIEEVIPGDPGSQETRITEWVDGPYAAHPVEPPVREREIPAVSTWGLIALTVLLLAAGAIVLARRKAAA